MKQSYEIIIKAAGKEVASCVKILPQGCGGELLKAVQDAAKVIQKREAKS
jgi:hypothetical protein